MTVWWTSSPVYTEELERIHVHAARIIHWLTKDIPDDKVLCSAKWDRFDYIYKGKILTMMYKVYQQTALEEFANHFSRKLMHSRDKLSLGYQDAREKLEEL